METISPFFLGALSGLFLTGIIYAFIGVLKITKSVRLLKDEVKTLNKIIEENIRYFDERCNVNYNDIEKSTSELLAETGKVRDELADEVNKTHQYIDSRLDKSIQTISNRMDALFVKKDVQQQINS